MNQISAFRSGTSVMVRYNEISRTIVHSNEEDAKATFRTVMWAKQNPTEENLVELKKVIDPDYKIKENEWIERDRFGNYYLAGYKTPLNQLLLEKLREYIDDGIDITPLVNFWKLLLLNPDIHVRDSLYQFASHFGFPITDKGYFIAYKSVAFAGKKHENLGIRVSQEYIYTRAAGENPDDLIVFELNTTPKDYAIVHKDSLKEFMDEHVTTREENVSLKELLSMSQEERDALDYDEEEDIYYRLISDSSNLPKELGTLTELFRDLPSLFDAEQDQFTDHHSRSMDIRLGVPVKQERSKCDNDPDVTCSSGLHVGTPQYVKSFGGRGSYILACLVNPMNVVAVPKDYNGQKMRCCEYLPYAVCEISEDGSFKEIEAKYFEEDYVNYEVQDLEEKLADMMGNPEYSEEEVQAVRNRLIQIQ